MSTRPVLSFEELNRQISAQKKRLINYSMAHGRQIVPAELFEQILDRSARSFKTINFRARMEFARVADQKWSRFLAETKVDRFFAFTLTPNVFAVPLSEGSCFDPNVVIKWTHKYLRRWSYLAVVDVAYYSTIGRGRAEPTLSWHVHALVWNCDEGAAKALCDHLNGTYHALLPSAPVAHFSPRRASSSQKFLMYSLKGPLKDYRAYPMKGEIIIPQTGEITIGNTSIYQQKKADIKPGALTKIFYQLNNISFLDIMSSSDDMKLFLIKLHVSALKEIFKEDHSRKRAIKQFL